jgi:hypothetical protein
MRLRRFLMTEPMRPPLPGRFADDGDANALARYGRLDTQVTRDTTRARAQPMSQVPADLHQADAAGKTPRSGEALTGRNPAPVSSSTDEGSPEVLVDCLLRYPEGPTHADRFQLAGVNQAIHGHL